MRDRESGTETLETMKCLKIDEKEILHLTAKFESSHAEAETLGALAMKTTDNCDLGEEIMSLTSGEAMLGIDSRDKMRCRYLFVSKDTGVSLILLLRNSLVAPPSYACAVLPMYTLTCGLSV